MCISILGLCKDVKLVSRQTFEFLGLVGIDDCKRWQFSESVKSGHGTGPIDGFL